MSLTVNIDTGNAAMTDTEHAAAALRRVADKLDNGFTQGPIFDDNGNHVGDFDFTLDLTSDEPVLGNCPHGVHLDREFCAEGCRV